MHLTRKEMLFNYFPTKITTVDIPTSRTIKRMVSVPNSVYKIEGKTH